LKFIVYSSINISGDAKANIGLSRRILNSGAQRWEAPGGAARAVPQTNRRRIPLPLTRYLTKAKLIDSFNQRELFFHQPDQKD
jgi:hypothetical protein